MKFINNLNIPKTSFSIKNKINNELELIKKIKYKNIYNFIIKKRKKNKIFFLHDGPPYANGNIHIGHAVNKILKDIIVKFKLLSGYNISFIPGWDCHGLPIELKIKNNNSNIELLNLKNTNSFFKECRNYTNNEIEKQKESFIKLGIIADWKNFYYTSNFNIESKIINILGELFNLGYLERKFKPVYWCIKCKSSISEMEVIYKNELSLSLYIKFELINVNTINIEKKYLKFKIYLISYTNTIWTLNDVTSISVNKNIFYNIIFYKNEVYILFNKILKNNNLKNINYININTIKGEKLINLRCINPLNKKNINIINNDSIDKNIESIINISPGHNLIDYELGIKNNLDILNSINENGFLFYNEYKKYIYIDEYKLIIKNFLFKNNKIFLYKNTYNKYPFCYRHNFKIFFRLTYQWFINLEHKNLREKAIELTKNVKWIPKWGKNKIQNMLYNRLEWCISRQRKWGIPITFFINKNNNEIHPKSYLFIKKISKKIKKYGIEYWNNLNIKDFLKKKDYNLFYKSKDILDVWFDSGSSLIFMSSLYKRMKKYKRADIYLEGQDQYRGWFMSSLLINAALLNKEPYKTVITHGFVLDNLNKKMSKSLGNVIDPNILINKYGSDVIRLWIASSNYNKDIKISIETLNRVSDIYKKIRNTLRFLISNLYDFNPNINCVKFNNMVKIDQWIINKLYFVQEKIMHNYNNYLFNNVITLISNFCIINLSSTYFEIIKDRQYIFNSDSKYRRSSQTAIFHILKSISIIISPILSFMSNEIYDNFIPNKKNKLVFIEKWYKLKRFNKNEKFNEDFWNIIFNIKHQINIILEEKIKKKYIQTFMEMDIILYIINKKKFFNKINILKNELKYIFIVSHVLLVKLKKINNNNNTINNNLKFSKINFIKIKTFHNFYKKKCNRCWNFYRKKYIKNKICKRCINIINYKEEKRFFA
ncbi:isoleucine--tRNA ligase [endosymbiont of Euscepes postfasciatus]|uniref:isoleucine--tRNA ligase n=1 Tax=endosymbiont of Euscepes postfasciatus TaxID=650377 RepID=UPI000DC731C5|nr:isoleucine--tRNA ligase [endosymbiont of Euscepes postfasciatus]BBA84619.1 isoleucine--tRNA ligase [endosymbiont of Euscepes postfasciatus]